MSKETITFKLTQRVSGIKNKKVLLQGVAGKEKNERHYTIKKGTKVTLLDDIRVNKAR